MRDGRLLPRGGEAPETVNALRAVGKVQKLVALSAGMPTDAMFARQLRRKFA